MNKTKEALIIEIEEARAKMDKSIDTRQSYQEIYQYSVELDQLINQYIVAGF